jgi:micrococcal nuclease
MGRYWKPEGNIVRIIPVGDRWDRRPPDRSGLRWPLIVLIGAVVLGLAAGYFLSRNGSAGDAKPDSPIEWNETQAVPKPLPDVPDEAWRRRSEELDAPSEGSEQSGGVRASFGTCYTGGGTNCVVDGDTFWIGGQKVRIAGIDAPETHPPRCAEEARLGNEATTMLRSLLNSGAVTMTSIDRDRDSYGRLLRNVAVNGQDVGEAMISAGVAREYGNGRRSWC